MFSRRVSMIFGMALASVAAARSMSVREAKVSAEIMELAMRETMSALPRRGHHGRSVLNLVPRNRGNGGGAERAAKRELALAAANAEFYARIPEPHLLNRMSRSDRRQVLDALAAG